MKRILFIDRDGTLIKEPPSDYQVDSLDKLEFMPGVFRNLFKLRQHTDFELEASIDTVFEAATDIPSWADRISGIQSVELLTDGPVGVGTKFRETRIMFGREATEEMEITGFDAPRSYTTEADSHGCHYVTKMTFEPSGSGTDVQMSFNAEPQTMFAKTMAAVMKPMIGKMRDMIGKDLDELKAAIEAKR